MSAGEGVPDFRAVQFCLTVHLNYERDLVDRSGRVVLVAECGDIDGEEILRNYLLALQRIPETNGSVGQMERCPKTNRLHLQLFVQMKTRMRWPTVYREIVGFLELAPQGSFACVYKRPHVEKAKGTPQQNVDYVTKAESRILDPIHLGTIDLGRRQGKRTDCHRALELIKEKKSIPEILEEVPSMLRYVNNVSCVSDMLKPKKSWPTMFVWLIGPAGIGKSLCARYIGSKLFGKGSLYYKDSTTWWQRYQQEPVIICDNFNANSLAWDMFCRLADATPLDVPFKGGSTPFAGRLMIFTTVWTPHLYLEKYRDMGASYAELTRRTCVQEFTQMGLGSQISKLKMDLLSNVYAERLKILIATTQVTEAGFFEDMGDPIFQV